MPFITFRPLKILSLLIGLSFMPLLHADNTSVDIDRLTTQEIIDKWGQVQYCQRIYQLPEVKPRLYDFDIEHCNQAMALATEVVSKYSQPEQEQLKLQAERHAFALSGNTSSPYQSVGACREYCQKLAAFKAQIEAEKQ
jgi:hypothetical protein